MPNIENTTQKLAHTHPSNQVNHVHRAASNTTLARTAFDVGVELRQAAQKSNFDRYDCVELFVGVALVAEERLQRKKIGAVLAYDVRLALFTVDDPNASSSQPHHSLQSVAARDLERAEEFASRFGFAKVRQLRLSCSFD